jgi:threonine dehydrogenase-like Zn-dependent dehydrogenase
MRLMEAGHTHAQAIKWPRPGVVRVVDITLREPRADDVVVDIAVTVTSTGTELARFRSLPNAVVDYPHRPGFMAAGIVAVSPGPPLEVGDTVAVRQVQHQSRAVVNPTNAHAIPPGVELVDGALWHLGLIALYGLRRGDYDPGAPLAIVGAGIVGAVARRLALATGTPECLVVATSDAKRWASAEDTGTRFIAQSGASLDHERERYPLTIDATGAAEGLKTAAALTAADGTVVLLGSPRAEFSALPVRDIQARGVRVVGAHIGTLKRFATEQRAPVEAELTETFFRLLAGGVSFADLIERRRPHDAPHVYEVAAKEPSFVAAAFDWSGDA